MNHDQQKEYEEHFSPDGEYIQYQMENPEMHDQPMKSNTIKPSQDKTVEKKIILDVTCAGRMMWIQKNHPAVIYSDIRKIPKGTIKKQKNWDISPDEINDWSNLPYKNDSFYLIVFDPPHMIRKKQSSGTLQTQYGVLNPLTWKEELLKGFNECWRVLKPNGVLIFKWNEQERSKKEVINIFPIQPLFGHPTGNKTHWLCYMKLN